MDNSADWADTTKPSKYFACEEETVTSATAARDRQQVAAMLRVTRPVADIPPHPRPEGPRPKRERKQRGAMLQKEGIWRNDETALHDPARMVRDCRAALNDPNSWLTHGYTAAIHLKYLLKEMGYPVPGDRLRKEE